MSTPTPHTAWRVAVFALPKLFDASLAVTLDVLKTARAVHALRGDGSISCAVSLHTWDGGAVETAAGFTSPAQGRFEDAQDAHVIILPGFGLWDIRALDAMLQSPASQLAIAALNRAHDQGARIAASCSAVFMLAQAGLLDGHRATTSWFLADAFRARFPKVDLQPDRVLVHGPNTVCAGAAMAQADLMLALVSQLWSSEVARWTARFLLIERRELQSRFFFSGLEADRHPDVARATQWIRDHIATPFTIQQLAQALGMSTRTLTRRLKAGTGQSPSAFVQSLRVQRTIHLLETSTHSLDAITTQVGYANTSSLRRLIKTHTGLTPGQIRARNM